MHGVSRKNLLHRWGDSSTELLVLVCFLCGGKHKLLGVYLSGRVLWSKRWDLYTMPSRVILSRGYHRHPLHRNNGWHVFTTGVKHAKPMCLCKRILFTLIYMHAVCPRFLQGKFRRPGLYSMQCWTIWACVGVVAYDFMHKLSYRHNFKCRKWRTLELWLSPRIHGNCKRHSLYCMRCR